MATVTLTLDDNDAFQIAAGLEQRIEVYKRTVAYHRGEEYDIMEGIEDCDEHDAQTMVDAYQRMIDDIYKQLREQKE